MRHGFLLINKPQGFTSHDVVGKVRKILSERSIGHLGTLDPMATGLLVLAVGKKALKVVELFSDLPKEYVADVAFGATSTTDDAEGVIERVLPAMGWEPPEQGSLARLLKERFLGTINQVPPDHSAVHVGGERAYRKARRGIGMNIPPREVTITSIDIISYSYPKLTLKVACGSGTYIRSLARDLGQLLRCGAYLSGLKRTKVGEWKLEDARILDAVTWGNVVPLKEILVDFPKIDLTDDELDDVSHGRGIEREVREPDTIAWHGDLPVAVMIPVAEGWSRARKVFI